MAKSPTVRRRGKSLDLVGSESVSDERRDHPPPPSTKNGETPHPTPGVFSTLAAQGGPIAEQTQLSSSYVVKEPTSEGPALPAAESLVPSLREASGLSSAQVEVSPSSPDKGPAELKPSPIDLPVKKEFIPPKSTSYCATLDRTTPQTSVKAPPSDLNALPATTPLPQAEEGVFAPLARLTDGAPKPLEMVNYPGLKPANVQKAERDAKSVDLIRVWRAEPWTFVKDVFGARPDAWQEDFLRALVQHDMLALKACKGPGKTCVLAWAIWWFFTTHLYPKILCTSITGDNLKDGLWTELAYWRNKSSMLQEMFEWQAERIYAKQHQDTWFASARTWPRGADKNQQATTLAGLHARNTLIVADEVGDIPSGVITAALAHHSTQDPDAKEVHKTLIAGNPTRMEGPLWDACTRDRSKWWVMEITGDPDDLKRAPRIDKEWARSEIEKWGKEHPYVLVNVFGKFPPTQDNKLLGPEIVQKAMRHVVPEAAWRSEPKIMALDVARSLNSDRSVICKRQGSVVFRFKVFRLDDLMELTSQVAFEFSEWKADIIFVDETGLGGGVVDRLRQLGVPVVGVNFGSRARDTRFADKRSEMWWEMSQAIKGSGGLPGLCLPNDTELASELTAPEHRFDRLSKLRLESKEDLKKRGLPSPDIADSLALTFAEPVFRNMSLSSNVENALQGNRCITEYDPYKGGESWRN